jgi:hypothetical protein
MHSTRHLILCGNYKKKEKEGRKEILNHTSHEVSNTDRFTLIQPDKNNTGSD